MQDRLGGDLGRVGASGSYPHASSDGGRGGSESESALWVEIGWRRWVFFAQDFGSGSGGFEFLKKLFLGKLCFLCELCLLCIFGSHSLITSYREI